MLSWKYTPYTLYYLNFFQEIQSAGPCGLILNIEGAITTDHSCIIKNRSEFSIFNIEYYSVRWLSTVVSSSHFDYSYTIVVYLSHPEYVVVESPSWSFSSSLFSRNLWKRRKKDGTIHHVN